MTIQRDGREMALKFLFCQEFLDKHSLQAPLNVRFAKFRASFNAQPSVWEHTKRLLEAFNQNDHLVDKQINSSLEKWTIDRLSLTDKSILRIAIAEINFLDTPPKVAINEAIDLGKKYSSNDSASFINGILDNVMHDENN